MKSASFKDKTGIENAAIDTDGAPEKKKEKLQKRKRKFIESRN